MSDPVAFLVGAGIGLVITIAVLWQRREEVGKAWQQRRGKGPKSMQSAVDSGALPRKRLTIGIHALAGLGAAYVAVVSDDGAIRAAGLLVCIVSVTSICVLLLQARRSGSST
jgi:hypothetical protein